MAWSNDTCKEDCKCIHACNTYISSQWWEREERYSPVVMLVGVHTLDGRVGTRKASLEKRSFICILLFRSTALRSSLDKLLRWRGILSSLTSFAPKFLTGVLFAAIIERRILFMNESAPIEETVGAQKWENCSGLSAPYSLRMTAWDN